jgi:hypothetical protein
MTRSYRRSGHRTVSPPNWCPLEDVWGRELCRVVFTARLPHPWNLTYRVLCRLVTTVGLLVRSGRDKDLESVVLRRRLTVLRPSDRPASTDRSRPHPARRHRGRTPPCPPRRGSSRPTPVALAPPTHCPPLDPTPPTRRTAAHHSRCTRTRNTDGTRQRAGKRYRSPARRVRRRGGR